MSDYINRQALLDRFEQLRNAAETLRDKIFLDGVLAIISCFRASDVQPVVRGRWIDNSKVPDSILSECSQCGYSCGAYTFNFCPNCGADMRGEVR